MSGINFTERAEHGCDTPAVRDSVPVWTPRLQISRTMLRR